MERRFPGPEGLVTAETRGDRAFFRAVRPIGEGGLWKAWLLGPRERYLLGTLIPEGGELRLGRTVPVAQLERLGVWPPVGAELLPGGTLPGCRMPPPPWQRRRSPGELMTDPLLARCLGRQEQALYCPAEGGFCLALPWSTEQPFPLTPLFCLGRRLVLEGESYVCFFFSRGGRPGLEEKV